MRVLIRILDSDIMVNYTVRQQLKRFRLSVGAVRLSHFLVFLLFPPRVEQLDFPMESLLVANEFGWNCLITKLLSQLFRRLGFWNRRYLTFSALSILVVGRIIFPAGNAVVVVVVREKILESRFSDSPEKSKIVLLNYWKRTTPLAKIALIAPVVS